MKIHELVSFNRELLERLHAAGVRHDDYRYVDLYTDYLRLTASGAKVTYVVARLSARHGVSERQVYNLVRRFAREITDCTPGAVK